MSYRKRREIPLRSARCEEHIRRHEKCPMDCPRRKCEYHAKLGEDCPRGCEHRAIELEQAKKDMEEQKRQQQQQQQQMLMNAPQQQTAAAQLAMPISLDLRFHSHVRTESLSNDQTQEELVPIRLDIAIGQQRLQDTITWNFYETQITPEQFAESLCIDLDLPDKFEFYIASAIRKQLLEYQQNAMNVKVPPEESIFAVRLNFTLNGVYMFDQFEWDLNNKDFTPEQFARSMCAELGLGYEFIVLIAHSIREQIYFYKSAYAKNRKELVSYYQRPSLITPENICREEAELPLWTPILNLASAMVDPSKMQKRQDQHSVLVSPYQYYPERMEDGFGRDDSFANFTNESEHVYEVHSDEDDEDRFLRKKAITKRQRLAQAAKFTPSTASKPQTRETNNNKATSSPAMPPKTPSSPLPTSKTDTIDSSSTQLTTVKAEATTEEKPNSEVMED